MTDPLPDISTHPRLLSAMERLESENQNLRQENTDLKIALTTVTEHGDLVEAELHEANAKLKAEMVERIRAEATLQTLVDMITRQKTDLEIIVQTIMEHGDSVDSQWHQKFCAALVQADIDGLTQIANRRKFDQYLAQQWQQMLEEERPLAIIMMDIDYFKSYNDTYGHLAGDACLVQVANALRQSLYNPADMIARYGGEEFIALLPRTHAAAATMVAQRIQQEIFKLKIAHHSSPAAPIVTLSLGVASLQPSLELSPTWLVKQADEQLYRAKRGGRNQVAVTAAEVRMPLE